MTNKQVIFVTVPDQQTGEKIAETLVVEKLAACGNLVPGLTSIYTWKNKLEKSQELLLIIKTRVELFEAVSRRVKELHPYEVPEIIAVPIEAGFSRYLDWIDDSVEPTRTKKQK